MPIDADDEPEEDEVDSDDEEAMMKVDADVSDLDNELEYTSRRVTKSVQMLKNSFE